MTLRLVIVTTIALAAGFGACRNREEKPAVIAPDARVGEAQKNQQDNIVAVSTEMLRDLRITTSTVEQHLGGESSNLLGELSVNQNAYAEVSAPLQARVVALRAVEGQTVQRGDLLATLESGELAKARSELATAEARVSLADRALERKRGLSAERIVPAREVQEAENEKASAEAQRRGAGAALQALGAPDLASDGASASTLLLRSPVGGTVMDRTVTLGQVADPSKPLFRIADLRTVWLIVHAFERDAVRLRKGAPARITFAAMPGRTFSGVIALIGQSVDADSRTVDVRIDLPNPERLFRPGMSATASLPVGNQGTVLAVPAAAVQRVHDQWSVFIPKDARTFEIRPVGRGRDLGGEVEIVSGLRAGEPIVVDGAFLLKAETEKATSEGEHEKERE
jgi:cobalt-zinc-cadmium efflux system membrane fusion protein